MIFNNKLYFNLYNKFKDFARKAKKIMVDIDKKETNLSRVKLEEMINCDAAYIHKFS